MSVLAWIFGLGAAAVVFPLVFHLIRRTPRGMTEFSTLMFLRPTPPTLTRRSRLDNWWLLLLRILAVALIAMAFMRPYFRFGNELADFDAGHRRVAILLDTSASMRRGSLWEEACQKVREALKELEDQDQVALLTFDQDASIVVDFAGDEASVGNQAAIDSIEKQLATLKPGWGRGDLGQALVSVASQLDDWQDQERSDQEGRRPKLQVIVISDVQESAATTALQSFQWPDLVKVDVRPVSLPDQGNATLEVLPGAEEDSVDQLRIRVTNHGDNPNDTFRVRWKAKGDSSPGEMTFLVPAGTSRTLPVPLADIQGVSEFELTGDTESFDNQFYLVPPQILERQVLFIGPGDGDDPASMLFYLQRALAGTSIREYQVVQRTADQVTADDWESADLVVVAEQLPESLAAQLQSQAESGVTALVALPLTPQSELPAVWKRLLAIDSWTAASQSQRTPKQDYRMWGEIDFTHPLFRPFASPGFSDFTKIRFWRHPRVELDEQATVVVRFDNGDPALWQRRLADQGQVLVLAAGWTPDQSQLALSSKFVPLWNNLVELAVGAPELDQILRVDQALVFPSLEAPGTLVKPHGGQRDIDAGTSRFRQTHMPGLYQVRRAEAAPSDADLTFAVNVDRRESSTEVMALDQLEQLGVQLGIQETAATELAQLRELRDRELEDRQGFWKWLLVAAILILVAETFYAGRKSGVAGAEAVLSAEVN